MDLIRGGHAEEVQIREEAKEEFGEGADSCVEQGRGLPILGVSARMAILQPAGSSVL